MICHLCNKPLSGEGPPEKVKERFMGRGSVHEICFHRWAKGEPMSSSNAEAKVDMPKTGGAASANGPPDQSNAGGKPATTKTVRVTDPMIRATQKLIRLLEEMPPDIRSWALAYCAIKYSEKRP